MRVRKVRIDDQGRPRCAHCGYGEFDSQRGWKLVSLFATGINVGYRQVKCLRCRNQNRLPSPTAASIRRLLRRTS